jgi:hypothetical protein
MWFSKQGIIKMAQDKNRVQKPTQPQPSKPSGMDRAEKSHTTDHSIRESTNTVLQTRPVPEPINKDKK